jgi:hypothetical protein
VGCKPSAYDHSLRKQFYCLSHRIIN